VAFAEPTAGVRLIYRLDRLWKTRLLGYVLGRGRRQWLVWLDRVGQVVMSVVGPLVPRRRRTPSVLKRRLPYLAAVATALAFAFLCLIVIGIAPTR
jgi:hypothetical protein